MRDGYDGLEILMLRRNPALKINGNHWVFPGGKLDQTELALDVEQGERLAAIRECREECGVNVKQISLVDYARWITPKIMPKRFDTGFYLAKVDQSIDVTIDNSEIVEHQWMKPQDGLIRLKSGEMPSRPPTVISLIDLLDYGSADDALAAHGESKSPLYRPKGFQLAKGQFCFLYEEDAGYVDENIENKSRLHRAMIDEEGMHYYRDNIKLL